MVLKTREKLIEVARQLFAHKGVENTTMNDIAAASDKGRRTIYTYFKNKREIYDAVIERESDAIIMRLREVVSSDLGHEEKLRKYLEARFDIVEETIRASTTSQIISYLTLDYKRLERIRLLSVRKEQGLFKEMIDAGVRDGVFDPQQALYLPQIHQMIFQGVDYCHLRRSFDELGMSADSIREAVIEFVINKLVVTKS